MALCMVAFSLDINGLFSHYEIHKQVPNSKHSKVFIISACACSSRVTLHRSHFCFLQDENE